MLQKEGKKSLHRIGRAILFYAFDDAFDGLPAARVLLEGGADPNEVCEGKTPWIFMLTDCNIRKPSDTEMLRPMLKRGADLVEIVLRDDSGWWRAHEKPVDRTTAFHVALTHLEYPTESGKTEIIKIFLGHCKCFDAVDSEGFGIVKWADTARYSTSSRKLEPWVGRFIRDEIAARTIQKRGKKHRCPFRLDCAIWR